MKISELIEKLKKFDPEAEVWIGKGECCGCSTSTTFKIKQDVYENGTKYIEINGY